MKFKLIENKQSILDQIKEFNNNLIKNYNWQIVLNDGDKIVDDNKDMDGIYKTLTPDQFEQYKGGVCWDFVPYQEQYFNNNFPEIKHSAYFHIFGNQEESPTHTFMLFWLDNKVYHFEAAWGKQKGIHEYDTEEDALRNISKKLVDEGKDALEGAIEYIFIVKYNSLDPKYLEISDDDYMEIQWNSKHYLDIKTSITNTSA